MATGYKGSGRGKGSMAMVPSQESVSPARTSESFGTTTMSPALALFTSTASLPIMTWILPRRSFLPVRPQTSSSPGSRYPEMTFRKVRRPTNGSDTVLKAKAQGGFVSSMRTVTSSAMRKRPWLFGCGK